MKGVKSTRGKVVKKRNLQILQYTVNVTASRLLCQIKTLIISKLCLWVKANYSKRGKKRSQYAL